MEKVIARVRFWYSTEIEVEVADLQDDNDIHDKVAEYADQFTVWNGNKSYREEFDDYEIEF